MKISKRKKLLLGLAATTLFTMTGCPADNDTGAPRGLIEDSDRPDVNNNQVEDVYGPPIDDIGPDDNVIEGVYGPPEWFNSGDPVITPDDNELNDVYGPPEWFDNGSDVNGNMEAPVYGPPPEDKN